MASMTIAHVGDDEFRASIRGHQLRLDQPVDDGGGDAGPTPTELFVAGLAGCVAHYARRFLARHDIDPSGLAVTAEWDLAVDRPARVGRIGLRIQPPAALPEHRRAALVAVASHCTVHNSLVRTPDVSIQLSDADVGAVA